MSSNHHVVNQLDKYDLDIANEILNWCFNVNKDTIILLWNVQGKLMFVSKSMEEFLDSHVEELLGEHWTSIIPNEQSQIIQEHFQRNRDKLTITNLVINKDSRLFTFEGMVDKIIIEDDEYFICHLKNITLVNDLKQTLVNHEKLILAGQLSAGLVHEIRNPLTSLKGFLQLVQSGIKQKEKYYKVMIGEIEKMEKITSELLNMAKPFRNDKKMEYTHQLIHDVLFLMNTQMDMREVEFITNLQENLLVYCNADQIKQVLINLIKNGAESMGKKGQITISTRKENEYIAFDIKDEGHGITDEIIQEINNPFFTTKSNGTGLGLVITQHILELHQGRLTVSSDESNGTTFTILLPAIKIQ